MELRMQVHKLEMERGSRYYEEMEHDRIVHCDILSIPMIKS